MSTPQDMALSDEKVSPSDATRVGLRRFTLVPKRSPFQWLDGSGMVEVDHGIELLA